MRDLCTRSYTVTVADAQGASDSSTWSGADLLRALRAGGAEQHTYMDREAALYAAADAAYTLHFRTADASVAYHVEGNGQDLQLLARMYLALQTHYPLRSGPAAAAQMDVTDARRREHAAVEQLRRSMAQLAQHGPEHVHMPAPPYPLRINAFTSQPEITAYVESAIDMGAGEELAQRLLETMERRVHAAAEVRARSRAVEQLLLRRGAPLDHADLAPRLQAALCCMREYDACYPDAHGGPIADLCAFAGLELTAAIEDRQRAEQGLPDHGGTRHFLSGHETLLLLEELGAQHWEGERVLCATEDPRVQAFTLDTGRLSTRLQGSGAEHDEFERRVETAQDGFAALATCAIERTLAPEPAQAPQQYADSAQPEGGTTP